MNICYNLNMNAKQIQTLLQDAMSISDEKYFLLPRSQRNPAIRVHIDAIKSAKDSLSAAAYRNFNAAIAAGDTAGAKTWQTIAGMSGSGAFSAAEMTADEAVAKIKTAVDALSAI